ncbi:MAG: ISAzo13 family transposase [Actinobacteria bacterium]|nr:ISAzo13 family transposase [Actinomycetota bacterium]
MTVLQEVVAPVTAGDPMSERQWVRASLRSLSRQLGEAGHPTSPPTVRRLLDDHGYRLHANTKQLEAGAAHPERDQQFQYIADQRQAFSTTGRPQISVDTKKKELIGRFKNAGRVWSQTAEVVNAHDFRQDALGRAVPYGIYDLPHNHGTVFVGQSADTPRFAVDMVARWWTSAGQVAFPEASELLILADGGGSNSARSRVWKQQLQEQLCDRHGLTVTVCHYPTGCSKWNPIEHRLFGPISSNWAGHPLHTWDTLLGYLRGTTTETGLTVSAALHAGVYHTGERVSNAELATLNLERHAVCPTWNYTLRPRSTLTTDPVPDTVTRELVL